MAASIAVQRPAWETSGVLRDELSTVVSNRSAALLELGDFLGSLVDAETVISIRRQWPKGHFRKARALVELGQIEEAKEAISLGLQFEPNNTVRHVHILYYLTRISHSSSGAWRIYARLGQHAGIT